MRTGDRGSLLLYMTCYQTGLEGNAKYLVLFQEIEIHFLCP